jgi:hypothetical protein
MPGAASTFAASVAQKERLQLLDSLQRDNFKQPDSFHDFSTSSTSKRKKGNDDYDDDDDDDDGMFLLLLLVGSRCCGGFF